MNKLFTKMCCLLCAGISLSTLVVSGSVTKPDNHDLQVLNTWSYGNYINVDISDFSASDNSATLESRFQGKTSGTVLQKDTGKAEWKVNIPSAGDYNIEVLYYTVAGKGAAISRNIYIDGQIPFSEANGVEFNRIYVNDVDKIQKDAYGNEIRPSQIEKNMWTTKIISDPTGYSSNPLIFHLSQGLHTLGFEVIREPMAIGGIRFKPVSHIPAYSTVKQDYDKNNYTPASNQDIKIQGENALYKSDSMLYPTTDRSSPKTESSNPYLTKFNTIGRDKWLTNGQWIIWNVDIPKDGLYNIALKARQNLINGASSNRKLYIDNVVPFSEMEKIKIDYDTRWQSITLSVGNKPYLFYLTKGTHEIKLEVTLGDVAPLLKDINESLTVLSKIYRNILMLTGPSPDQNRDYKFESQIPDTLLLIKQQKDKFYEYINRYKALTGQSGEQLQTLKIIYEQLKLIDGDSSKIKTQFSLLETNISSLGNWLVTGKKQPLEIDYITFFPPDHKPESIKSSFLSDFVFNLKAFFASFVVNYNNMKNENDQNTLKVWIGSTLTNQAGRDQANVIKQMAVNDFTAKKNITVDLQLVSPGVLLPSSLAGKNPDVALSQGGADPVNYAVRNAVVDLTQFEDFKQVSKRFTESSLVPLTFNNKTYALPETLNYPMLFYRKDILEELGLSIPQTWNDVKTMIPVLQKKQLSFGLPLPVSNDGVGIGISAYAMFLFQNGGTFYTPNGGKCILDSKVAVDSFYDWTSYYNNYSLPVQYDFANRFRTGSMPIAIADYGTFNMLSVFAPEIQGKWGFTTVPGTRKSDGTIDKSVSGTVTACVIMRASTKQKQAWEFLKWWTDSPVQVKYANEIESIMGTAARYAAANTEALYQIPWSTSEYNAIVDQRQWVKCIPEVPGGYFTPRYLDFAFKKVCVYKPTEYMEPGEILQDAVTSINTEINAKRKEFGLK